MGCPGFAQASGGGKRDDESTMTLLVKRIGRKNPSGKVRGPLVVAGGLRGDSEPARCPHIGNTRALPSRGRPVLVWVFGKKLPSIDLQDPSVVTGLGGLLEIVYIEAGLVQIQPDRGTIGDDAAPENPADCRELD
jgi:hypothetical protein